ncbi:uncharacterized protein LOC134533467 [Bacillus rossius redtenbacheri]|uniref:uncharacterized protein LOC134533467 n=1 Tax=Bacillus rossius redtenbacheri TaxID=93214 RepID=UPI002FDD6062
MSWRSLTLWWVPPASSFREQFIEVRRNDRIMFQHNCSSPLLFYFFTLAVEDGYVDWSANCDPPDVDLPARNGGWSQWSPWSCSVSCGGGVGRQTRTCSNPRPNVHGRPCSGVDSHTGPCNTFPCGDISSDTEELLRHRLRTRHYSQEVWEGDAVVLPCDPEGLAAARREAPRARVNWTKGADYLQSSARVRVSSRAVEVRSAEPRDSGVYVCLLHRPTGVLTTLRVHGLAVQPRSSTAGARQTRLLVLRCGGEALGAVYSDLERRWLHEGVVWRDRRVAALQAVDELVIQRLNSSHAGEWKCIMLQEDLGFVWTTSWHRVRVDPAPTLLTYLMEDPLTSPLFGHLRSETAVLVFLIVFTLLVVIMVAALVFLYLRYGTLP